MASHGGSDSGSYGDEDEERYSNHGELRITLRQ